MHDVIKGCIEVLQQSGDCLEVIDDNIYQGVVRPFFTSSAGEHMRHILDHFLAIKAGRGSSIINYDRRHRGSNIEHDRAQALALIGEIRSWLLSLNDEVLSRAVSVETEVALSETVVVEVNSSLQRELVFAASHAVHHYSSIALLIKMQHGSIDKSFGLAPATASYLRQQNAQCARSAG